MLGIEPVCLGTEWVILCGALWVDRHAVDVVTRHVVRVGARCWHFAVGRCWFVLILFDVCVLGFSGGGLCGRGGVVAFEG